MIPKVEQEFTEGEKINAEENYRIALNILCSAIDLSQFNKVFTYETTKEMRHTLITIHEEAGHIKETKISI